MNTFEISGGEKLEGEIIPQGAKNECLQILCAVLLTDELITIKNIPDIIDVNVLINLLKNLGVKIVKKSDGCYSFKADKINLDFLMSNDYIKESKKIRGSIMMIGPILSRFGSAVIPKPGGDKIGRRSLDTHFDSLSELGGVIKYDNKKSFYFIEATNLKGKKIILNEPSVTGTANLVMASVLASGKTIIYNAACEPYIQKLCLMLNSMGADIKGIKSNLLIIQGVKKLKGTEHTISPDFVEIGSWIGLAAMTKSKLVIKNVDFESLNQIINIYKKMGINTEKRGNDLLIPAHENGYKISDNIDGSILTISDGPWPGLTPDILSIILVVATQAEGSLLIHQKMFESRLFFVDKLIDMGAKIILCDPHRATVIGLNFKSKLKASTLVSPDIRAGISLLIAALSAKGKSYINNVQQIDRGYQNIVKRLQMIGAKIKRV